MEIFNKEEEELKERINNYAGEELWIEFTIDDVKVRFPGYIAQSNFDIGVTIKANFPKTIAKISPHIIGDGIDVPVLCINGNYVETPMDHATFLRGLRFVDHAVKTGVVIMEDTQDDIDTYAGPIDAYCAFS
jgi:hypothetical protein